MDMTLIDALKAARLHIQGEALPTKVQALDIINRALGNAPAAAAGAPDLRSAIPTVPQEMLTAAMRKAVALELFPKHADAGSYLKLWDGMKQTLAAALASAAPVEATPPQRELNEVARAIETRIKGPNTDALVVAVSKLIKAKGRFHTEQNYAELVAAYDAVKDQPAGGAS